MTRNVEMLGLAMVAALANERGAMECQRGALWLLR